MRRMLDRGTLAFFGQLFHFLLLGLLNINHCIVCVYNIFRDMPYLIGHGIVHRLKVREHFGL